MASIKLRWILGISSVLGLLSLFLFQKTNVAGFIGIDGGTARFIFNKTFRFVLNDILMIGLIYALFTQKRFVLFALVVQVLGIVFVLLPYFILKLYFHTGNGPLVSFLHRLILNPTLMILLIPAFWLQGRKQKLST
jgi:exosortase F-associated protein